MPRNNEWAGTVLEFRLTARSPSETELDFRHGGLPAVLVTRGRDHFLASLAAYAETGTGAPSAT